MKRPRQYPMCKPCGKRRCPTETAAEHMAAYQMHTICGFALSVYRCPHGNGWHITRASQVRRDGW